MEGLPIKSRRQVREDDGGGASNFFGTPTLALALDPGLTLVELRYCSVGVPKEFRRSSEGVLVFSDGVYHRPTAQKAHKMGARLQGNHGFVLVFRVDTIGILGTLSPGLSNA